MEQWLLDWLWGVFNLHEKKPVIMWGGGGGVGAGDQSKCQEHRRGVRGVVVSKRIMSLSSSLFFGNSLSSWFTFWPVAPLCLHLCPAQKDITGLGILPWSSKSFSLPWVLLPWTPPVHTLDPVSFSASLPASLSSIHQVEPRSLFSLTRPS